MSLGGKALLRWLGESQHAADLVDAACAVSAPLDLAGGGAALSSGLNMIYDAWLKPHRSAADLFTINSLIAIKPRPSSNSEFSYWYNLLQS